MKLRQKLSKKGDCFVESHCLFGIVDLTMLHLDVICLLAEVKTG